MPQRQKCHADDIIQFYIITAVSDNKISVLRSQNVGGF